MIKRSLAALLLLLVAVPSYADFNAIARALDRHDGVKRVWIPFLGLARVFVRAIQPEGVHDFQLATFEGTDNIDPRELRSLMQTKVGPGFKPLVQVWSRKSRDWSFIYVRPGRRDARMELIILAHDNEDTVLVRVDVDAEVLARELGEPRNVSKMARH